MAAPDHPDRERWPEYWRAIRRGAIVVVVTVGVAVTMFSFEQRLAPLDAAWRFALVFVVAFAFGIMGERLIDWFAARWERWLGHH